MANASLTIEQKKAVRIKITQLAISEVTKKLAQSDNK